MLGVGKTFFGYNRNLVIVSIVFDSMIILSVFMDLVCLAVDIAFMKIWYLKF